MGDHWVVCTNQDPSGASHDRAHIVQVGHQGTKEVLLEAVETVRRKLDAGHSYHTVSPSTGTRASVHKVDCRCGFKTIRSAADAVLDNNLDNLRACRLG